MPRWFKLSPDGIRSRITSTRPGKGVWSCSVSPKFTGRQPLSIERFAINGKLHRSIKCWRIADLSRAHFYGRSLITRYRMGNVA